MQTFSNEIGLVQNPAIGAAAVWRFCCGFTRDVTASETPFAYAFLVLPIVFYERTLKPVLGTQRRTGLRGFESKLTGNDASKGSREDLFGIAERALALRKTTLEAISISLRSRLLLLNSTAGTLMPVTYTKKAVVGPSSSNILDASEKLGFWFSQVSAFELTRTLRVSL